MTTLFRAMGSAVTAQSLTAASRHLQPLNVGASGLVFVRTMGAESKSKKSLAGSYLKKRTGGAFSALEENLEKKFEGRAPNDDVWIRKYYPPPRYSLLEAVKMHREAAAPEIHNNESGMLILNCKLDLRTRKKTKFMKEFTHTVLLPNYFDDGIVRRLMVFCKNIEDKNLAESLGSEYCGGVDLVKSLLKGEIKHDEYDHVICATDFFEEMSVARKYLRDRFPSIKTGNVGSDIRGMFKFFTEGKTYESRNVAERYGKLTARFATLNMTDQQIQENYEKFLEEICSLKNVNLGQFIVRCSLECPPSPEHFLIHEKELLPVSQRGKKVELVQDEEPAPKSEDDDDDIPAQAAVKQ